MTPNGGYDPVPVEEHDRLIREARLRVQRAVLDGLLDGAGSTQRQAELLVELLARGPLADAVRDELNARYDELTARAIRGAARFAEIMGGLTDGK